MCVVVKEDIRVHAGSFVTMRSAAQSNIIMIELWSSIIYIQPELDVEHKFTNIVDIRYVIRNLLIGVKQKLY